LSRTPEQAKENEIVETAIEMQASLNLATGPLLRVALFNLGAGQSQRLLIIAHHLVVDGISWRVLMEDLQTAYLQMKAARTIQLPPKTTSYKYWAERLSEYANSPLLEEEVSYWLKRTRTNVNPLPVDHKDGKNTAASARTLSVSLSAEQTSRLLQDVSAAFHVQINETLLTALSRAFSIWTGDDYMIVDLEGHGREDLFPDVDTSRTVGWFTTIFPVELDLTESRSIPAALTRTRSQMRPIPHHGIGYCVLRYLRDDAEVSRKLRALPEAEVSFNYLGQFDQTLAGLFQLKPAPEYSGPSRTNTGKRAHLIDITARVVEGEFKATWTYSENIHNRETIDQVARSFLTELEATIDCAKSQVISETTLPALPGNQFEEVVASVWRDSLGIEAIDINDDFFVLGGTFSSAQQVVAKLNELYEIELPKQMLLDYPTIAQLSTAITEILLNEVEQLSDDEINQLTSSTPEPH